MRRRKKKSQFIKNINRLVKKVHRLLKKKKHRKKKPGQKLKAGIRKIKRIYNIARTVEQIRIKGPAMLLSPILKLFGRK